MVDWEAHKAAGCEAAILAALIFGVLIVLLMSGVAA